MAAALAGCSGVAWARGRLCSRCNSATGTCRKCHCGSKTVTNSPLPTALPGSQGRRCKPMFIHCSHSKGSRPGARCRGCLTMPQQQMSRCMEIGGILTAETRHLALAAAMQRRRRVAPVGGLASHVRRPPAGRCSADATASPRAAPADLPPAPLVCSGLAAVALAAAYLCRWRRAGGLPCCCDYRVSEPMALKCP